MLFVNYKISTSKDNLLSVLRNNNMVVDAENYDTKRGKPKMHIKEKNQRIKIKCELTERATKDDGFLEGTYFVGSVKEKNGVTKMSGVILTAPIYHLLFLLLFGFFVYRCFAVGGISVIPIILVIFDIFMFRDEFRKQRLIKRYIFRAFKLTYLNTQTKNKQL